jgi:hypothetical protein
MAVSAHMRWLSGEEQIVTTAGVPPALPATVKATFNDGSADNVNTRVSWREVDPSEYAQPGTFVVTGTVEGTSLRHARP